MLGKYHRGRLLRRQTWTFGCLSRLTKKIHVELIPNKSRTTLDPIVEANVRTGTYLMSDMHRAYDNIHLRLGMRGHSSVNHSENFVGGTIDIPVDDSLGVPAPGGNVRVKIHTNTIERQWRELKQHCRSCRSQRRLKWYMGEYMYRHNILKQLPSEAARFRRLLRDMHRVYPGLGMHRVLHGFPNSQRDRERFNTWLYAIGGDILGLENERIFKYRPQLSLKRLTSVNRQPLQQILEQPSTSSECKETADLLLFMDKIFDSVNGSQMKNKNAKPLLGPATPHSVHNKTWVEGIKIRLEGKKRFPP
ncbi:hypothetical protein HW555_003950 [Spodoptera exigua]|uniref:ISXO2-like transposase domain-containing protein n=1 Tax=Spodoptera exigua TaxID=7107 RepID=A0A835GMV5_SPOEX|nr:hypothetical protein HW555_003950 [Spodoptera exigua]